MPAARQQSPTQRRATPARGRSQARKRRRTRRASHRSRAARATTGHIMAQLVRGRSGAPSGVLDTLESLRLRTIGHARVLGGDPDAVLGALHKVRHWVRVYPLTAHAVPWVSQVETYQPERGINLQSHRYQVGGYPAVECNLGREHYARCECYDDTFVLGWSTGLSIATVLTEVRSQLPQDEAGTAVVVHRERQGPMELSAGEVIEDLLVYEQPYSLVRFEWPTMTVIWSRPFYPLHQDEYLAPGSLAMISSDYDRKCVKKLIRCTATEPVYRHVAGVLEEVGKVAASIGKSSS
jgi:ribosomal protein L30/L7E